MKVPRASMFAIVYLTAILVGVSYSATEPAPNIQFDETLHDFGTIDQNEKHTHVFKFKNAGDATLNVGKVRTSCGCTAALISSKEIPPQETGELKVTFDSGSFEGLVTKTIYIESNDPDEPTAKVQIKATIRTVVAVRPRYLYFGKIDKGATPEMTAMIFAQEKGMKITKVEYSQEYISAKLSELTKEDKESVKLPEGITNENGFKLEVALNGKIKVGNFYESIKLHTNSEKKRLINVPVQARVMGEIRLEPETISFGKVKNGNASSRSLIVSKINEKTLEISKVESDSEWISTKVSVKEEGAKYEITVELKPDTPPGRIREQIKIHTNSAEQTVLSAYVFAIVEE